MINSSEELKFYLSEDSRSYHRVLIKSYTWKEIVRKIRTRYFSTPISDQWIVWKYIKVLRYAEYYANKNSIIYFPILAYYTRKLLLLGRKTGFQIPIRSIKEGLTIWHYGTIIINPATRIGSHCTLQPNIVIGHKNSGEKSPIIGDNVVINSGARIIGDIQIGDDVIIAPNAVVTHDVPSHSIVAGVPAKIIKYRDSAEGDWKVFKQVPKDVP